MKKSEENSNKIRYSAIVGGKKESLTEIIAKSFPKTMIPTKRIGWILGIIFIIVIAIGFLKFPLGSLLSGKTDISLEIGLPKTFLELNLENPESMPFRIPGLIIDLFLYLLIAYFIDISLNSFLSLLFPEIKEKNTKPQQYKILKN